MKILFVDDIRTPPSAEAEDVVMVARSFNEATGLLSAGHFDAISLDHDLGEGQKTGYDLAKWMSENDKWPEAVAFHTANPVGRSNMYNEWVFYNRHNTKKCDHNFGYPDGPPYIGQQRCLKCNEEKPYDGVLDREIV